MLSNIEQLHHLLVPSGITALSNQSKEEEDFFLHQFGTTGSSAIHTIHQANIHKLISAKKCIVGYPCDNGAGLQRGAKFGPQAIRMCLSPIDIENKQVVDLGDIRDHPLLVHDAMTAKWALQDVSMDRYGKDLSDEIPISPLSSLERVLANIMSINPMICPVILGGDHSLSLLPVTLLAKMHDFAVIHFDAHTDLLKTRNGLPYSYSTWAFHAVKELPTPRHLMQIGISQTKKTKKEWESAHNIFQIWAEEILSTEIKETLHKIETHLASLSCKKIYISLDIDVLSSDYIQGAGTLSKQGLSPETLSRILDFLRAKYQLIGADLVEVAPKLEKQPSQTAKIAANMLCKLLL